MRRSISFSLDHQSIIDVVGTATFQRALDTARAGAVLNWEWMEAEEELVGFVSGRTGEIYSTACWFEPDESDLFELVGGECSCPMRSDCKHVAALVLHALRLATTPIQGAPVGTPRDWAATLDSLVGSVSGTAAAADTVPLALELSLTREPARPTYGGIAPAGAVGFRLLARILRRGKNGGWVAGGLTWNRLDGATPPSPAGEYDPAALRAAREFYLLHRAASSTRSHSYGYGNGYASGEVKVIDLGAIGSRALWPLLTEGAAAGLRLVHADAALGELAPPVTASLTLDVTAGESGALHVAPVLVTDGARIEGVPVLFTADGHGAVIVDAATVATGDPASWPLRLVALDRPAPDALRELAANSAGIVVPAERVGLFRTEYYPRLRALAEITSSDSSFAAPSISEPTLVLRADYGPEHALELAWEWAYEVDGAGRRAALANGGEGFRDPGAERRILAELAGSTDTLGALGGEPGTPNSRTAMAGLDTMRFSTELLPLLRDQRDLSVEVAGSPAHYREAGDTLRIGVSADDIPADNDWFDLGVQISVEGREVPFLEVFLALSRGESHLLLADGAYFSLDKPAMQGLRRLIEEARALQERPGDPLRISRYQAGLWDELSELGIVERQSSAWSRQVAGLLELGSLPAPAPPAGLTATLRPYQLAGFQWLSFLWEHGLGGILADDMGLGKTVQTLALFAHARTVDPGAAPFLIVAPTSVVSNWAAESARFTPGLTTVTITDTLRRSGLDLADVVAGADIVVTSYTLFRLDFEAYERSGWSGLILDEAQFIKNHQSRAYACARTLPAPFKLAITGTPMENNLMELWSLLSVGAPGLFPSPTRFKEFFERPIAGRKGASAEGAERLTALRRRIRPLMLRRTKEQVATELPPKQEQVVQIDLHPAHRVIYDRHLQRERQKVLGLLEDMDRNRFVIFRSLTLLRQLSLHAALVDDVHADVPSAKIDALVEHLGQVVAGGHRALIFSQFTGLLHLVRARLEAEGIEFCYLDGKTRSRGKVIERFKGGTAPVFLISLKAGGFGLNLTEADYCFLLDPWWNPATEAQAVDRTHRIGQTRTVLVYRFIAANTIEAKVRELAARKAELFADVMGGDDAGEAFSRVLGAEDIRGLFA